jgi:hypothetical protein
VDLGDFQITAIMGTAITLWAVVRELGMLTLRVLASGDVLRGKTGQIMDPNVAFL